MSKSKKHPIAADTVAQRIRRRLAIDGRFLIRLPPALHPYLDDCRVLVDREVDGKLHRTIDSGYRTNIERLARDIGVLADDEIIS